MKGQHRLTECSYIIITEKNITRDIKIDNKGIKFKNLQNNNIQNIFDPFILTHYYNASQFEKKNCTR